MFDVIVIGGGITGAGILKSCAEAKLKVLLIEKDDVGGHTTLSSSGLIHGGLRYLPYDAHTTAECCRETSQIIEFARDLMSRQVFLWPVYSGQKFGLELVESLLERYDRFAPLKSGKRHVRLTAEETLSIEPFLNSRNLLGAITFDEWKIEPSRLVAKNIDAAKIHGAQVASRTKVIEIKPLGRQQIKIETVREGRRETLETRLLVNAAGPWAGQIAAMAGAPSVKLEHRKGVHLVLPNPAVRFGSLFPDRNGRYIGAYPRNGDLWIGPTDDPLENSLDNLRVTPEEEDRLQEAALRIFPKLDVSRNRYTIGVRPILAQKGSPSFFSRDYRIFDHEALEGIFGFITVTGGKMTIYRLMAEKTMELIHSKLENKPAPGAPELSDMTRLLRMAGSVALLALAWWRHWLLRLCGQKREGLSLFKATYETS